jgi:hypothetical protein
MAGLGLNGANVSAALQPFLQANSVSAVEEQDVKGQKHVLIKRPWGDSSLAFRVPANFDPLAEALNNLLLPPRYSAVWHRDTKDLEILWTAFRLKGAQADVAGRTFLFKFRNTEYKCGFERSSARVLTLARCIAPQGQSETGYRNLWSFDIFVSRELVELQESLGEPLSFWIRSVEWNEDEVLALVMHLNFYLSYFDASSPVVLIHPPPMTAAKKPTRYPAGAFPNKISCTEIDTPLLYLWEAAHKGEPTERFLYYYRIIEYSASIYLDSSARTALRIALSLPNALDNLVGVTESVVAAVQKMNLTDPSRYDMMLKEIVDPKLLWRELNLNLGAFVTDTQFDGGFKVPALFAIGRTEADFTSNDVFIFGRTIRDMRNALVHGRDQKTQTTITPTTQNSSRLQSWIAPVRLAASQVILYKDVF